MGYPFGRDGDVRTPSGRRLADLRLDDDSLTREELPATPETLRLQAEVAESAGRTPLARNLRRAAELATVPEDVVLEIYTALRPRRSTADELEAWARRLDEAGAPQSAAFVREAAAVYAARGLLA
ncbi:MAG TPA: diol dehydratase small subunit [Gaiellaceae bacterium]|nr:diol dehydratase small subunit [Gaiellaceae bacterium]